jgi:hypothetical protein
MEPKHPRLAAVRAARKMFHVSLGAAIVLAVIVVVYMAATNETLQSSMLVKAMIVALGALIVVPGMRAMGIPCPACSKPFHSKPVQALLPRDKCGNCGFPEVSASG